MSTPRIIITLSAATISLSYSKGDGSGRTEPFPGSLWPASLKTFGQEATAPRFKIGKGVDERVRSLFEEGILTDDDGEAGYKDNLEVLLLTENDLDGSDISNAKGDLERWGFKNLRVMHPDVAVTEFYCNENDNKGLVIVSSNGNDVSVSLYNRESPDAVRRFNLSGMAKDSREEALAEKIWELVKDYTLGLSYETEAPVLRKIAGDFLKTNAKELEGPVRLSDGQNYDFFLVRSSLKNLTQANNSLQTKFTDILLDNDMSDRSGLALILRNDAVGNLFIKEMVAEAFAKVEEESGSLRDAVNLYITCKEWNSLNDIVSVKERRRVEKEPATDKNKDKEKKDGPEIQSPPDPEPAKRKLIPVIITAEIERVRKGLFGRKSFLKINIDIPDRPNLPWKSVLCVQEDPLSTIDRRYVVKEYPREERPPFGLKLDLPLKSSPNAKKLRVYFYPDPDEPVGINNVYDFDPVIVKLD